jgi:hypothetical protein
MTKRTAILLALTACAADARSPDPRDPGDPGPPSQPGQKMHILTLTATAPRQDLAISPLPAEPATLTLTIAGIADPSAQAFSVGASVVWSAPGAGAIEETIGSITPYPPTRPGRFALGVPEAARRTLARGDGQLSLRLTLQPISADRPLAEPLRVTLADPAWR